jgi:Chaperone of endosialidase
MAVPYTFGNATTSIPLSQLDSNFATAITLGNTAVYLGNTTTSFGNVTLTNATISSGNATLTKVTTPTVNAGSGNALTLQSNSTTGLYIDTSQNVGIGTTSPAYKLHVYGGSGASVVYSSATSGQVAYVSVAGNGNTFGTNSFDMIQNSTSTFLFNRDNTPMVFGTNNAERMRIDSSGNLLVGTTTAGGYATSGTLVVNTKTYVGTNTTSTGALGSGTIMSVITDGDNPQLIFVANNATTDRKTFRFIGRTDGTAQIQYLNDATTSETDLIRFNTVLGSVSFPNISTTASGANAFLDNANSNRLLRSTSSLRYKTDVENLNSSYSSNIYKMRPVWYRSKSDNDRSDWSWYGLIAEEVAEIEPRLVNWSYLPEDYDDIEGEKVLKKTAKLIPDSVQYDRLTVFLLKEIQQLKAELDALKGTK